MESKQGDKQAVTHWRRVELLQFGFPRPLAARVARDERYDLHELIELVRNGCPPALAARIVAPLDGRDAA